MLMVEELENFKSLNKSNVSREMRQYADYNRRFVNSVEDYEGDENLYFGVENEVEMSSTNVYARHVDLIKNPYLLYKDDASLNNGFEMCSNPMTLKSHSKWIWKEVLETIRQGDVKNPDKTDNATNGLHIHVSKNYMSNMKWKRLFLFLEQNQDFIFRLSRRNPKRFSEWSRFRTSLTDGEPDISGRNLYDKYFVARKTRKGGAEKGTVEFRFFKATLNYKFLFQYLNLIDGLVHYFKYSIGNKHNLKDVIDFMKPNPIILKYLTDRGILNKNGNIKKQKFEYFNVSGRIYRMPVQIPDLIRKHGIDRSVWDRDKLYRFNIKNKKFKSLTDIRRYEAYHKTEIKRRGISDWNTYPYTTKFIGHHLQQLNYTKKLNELIKKYK
jgi:hypothetical protein